MGNSNYQLVQPLPYPNIDIIQEIESRSGRDPNAMKPNKKGALGPYQITPIMWKDLQQNFRDRYGTQKFADVALDPKAARWAAWDAMQLNARYLKHYGIPVNEETLAAAYNLGAKGVADRKADLNKYPSETRNYILKYRILKANKERANAVQK